jgi:hypothetical protein
MSTNCIEYDYGNHTIKDFFYVYITETMEPQHNPFVNFRLNDLPAGNLNNIREYSGHINYPDKDITKKSPPCPEPQAPYNQLVFANNVTHTDMEFIQGFYISDIIDRDVLGDHQVYRCKYRYRHDTWARIIHRQLIDVDMNRVAHEFRLPNAIDFDLNVHEPGSHFLDELNASIAININVMTLIFLIPNFDGSQAVSDAVRGRIHRIMTANPPNDQMMNDLSLYLNVLIGLIDDNDNNHLLIFNDQLYVNLIHTICLTANNLIPQLWEPLMEIMREFLSILFMHRQERLGLQRNADTNAIEFNNINEFNGLNVIQLLFTVYPGRSINNDKTNDLNNVIEDSFAGHPSGLLYAEAIAIGAVI